MNRRKFLQLTGVAGLGMQRFGNMPLWSEANGSGSASRILGMYVHEGWPYNHPYAARTWTVEDWRGYAGGLSKLGFNTIIIWPAIEIMPDPLTPSDRAHLETTAQVVAMLRREFRLRVYITLCPNVVPYQQVAEKYTFESRPLFASTTLLNPADHPAVRQMIERREKFLRPMAEMDGLVLIDSDPSGYPGSTNAQFADLLYEYRKMLNQLRPRIELVYWMHMGWQAMSRYEATGVFHWGNPAEAEDILLRLKKFTMDPWRITIHTLNPPPNGTDLKLAEKFNVAASSLAFNYGALEAEPSFPITNFGGDAAFKAGQLSAPGGVVGNAQTHCMQLPNTFAFARGGEGKTLPSDADYVGFADQLIQGQGQRIVTGWKALAGTNATTMRAAAEQLDALTGDRLTQGPLQGLLFGDPHRFITDLVMELRLKAAFEDFVAATVAHEGVKKSFRTFVEATAQYQKRTGYQCVWDWPRLDTALETLKSPKIDAILDEKEFIKEIKFKRGVPKPGGPYHNRYSDGLMQLETSMPRLIAAMQEASAAM
jgi:hypothetical protein